MIDIEFKLTFGFKNIGAESEETTPITQLH
jgi:hypothetical protein